MISEQSNNDIIPEISPTDSLLSFNRFSRFQNANLAGGISAFDCFGKLEGYLAFFKVKAFPVVVFRARFCDINKGFVADVIAADVFDAVAC